MINTLEEFILKYPKSVVVSYDAANFNREGYGVIYRTTTRKTERFRKLNGKYIIYPQIQPYLQLNEDSNFSLFIIRNNKIYKLKKGEKNNTYKIEQEIFNVNISMFDYIFENSGRNDNNHNKPQNRSDEPIYIIEE